MRKLVFVCLLLQSTLCVAFGYDSTDLDFSIKPKMSFTKQTVSAEGAGGLSEAKGSAEKNKSDVALKDKKLLRGFERFVKTDAFGDALPDSFLFYREQLTANEKSAYDEVYKALMNASPSLDIITRIKQKELYRVMEAMWYDNPEIFWWSCQYCYYYNSDGTITRIMFEYLFPKEEMRARSRAFLNMSLPIIFYANLLESDMDKAKYVHDYLCLSIDYDWDAYNSGKYGGKLQSAYSAVVEYKTVCAGYSRAFAYYMQQLKIPCTVLHGSGHAWNMIEIAGDFYQMDVTWDDGKQTPPYFTLSHSAMQSVNMHTPNDLPAAIIRANPTRTAKMSYEAYFGNTPIGRPYTYREFANIADDIENPAYAEVYKDYR